MKILTMFLLSVIEKVIDWLETKLADVDPSLVGQHVQPLKNNYFKPCVALVFIRDRKLKFCLRNSIFGLFWDQNVGPGWVKNDKNVYFHTSHLTPNSVFPKEEVLKSHSLLTH